MVVAYWLRRSGPRRTSTRSRRRLATENGSLALSFSLEGKTLEKKCPLRRYQRHDLSVSSVCYQVGNLSIAIGAVRLFIPYLNRTRNVNQRYGIWAPPISMRI
ncbi:unnamed protein product [Haemonchus placei]|uniref:Uncharacterized protein n=1 Tax=Haemonchus placei TaxID=6290 RepID=A0A0N4WFK2_HAEPC|nr:unnamed protein product [Haemonchus placei]